MNLAKMNIALLSFEYPPETGYGGIGTYTWYQARALTKLGHKVHVLAGADEITSLRKTQHDGVTVFRYRNKSFADPALQVFDKMRLWWSKNRLENGIAMFQAFRDLTKEFSYDIVEMPECGAEGLFINHFSKIPTLIKFHSPARLIMPFYDVRKADFRVCSALEQSAIRNAKNFTACSKFMAEDARNKLKIRKPIQVIPNGIDLELFDRAEQIDVLAKFGIRKDRLIVLFNGRMENRKGIFLCKEIVPAILEKYEATFLFAGQDLFDIMRDILLPYWNTRNFRGSVHYMGKLDQMDVRSLLRQSDIFLLPSLWENCPYSCLEAMAAECAVVSTNQGGMPEIIEDHKNGLLANNNSTSSYVQCIAELIENHAEREQLKKSARRTIEQSFTDCRIAELSSQYYEQCIGRS